MGKRTEGKPKKKSIKANVTSKFGSKRKLSRMGKKVKKGEMGPSTEFVTRSSALKRLQITLKDFRRLCILKGIYPRVPTKAPKGADKVYYELKDISYLAHEPLLHKFREFKSFMKKIRKAAGRKEFEDARRKNEMKPKFVLNHLIKERYPRFIDALRDLDDALCMVHLFAALPSQGRVTSQHTLTCSELVRHWQYYVAKSQTLQKAFISIKGIYFQAEILGEPITWLAPHQFTQAIPKEVDFRVMMCFLEFYEVFLKFVMFKLFHNMDLQYPPVVHKDLNDAGCFLLAVQALEQADEGVAAAAGASTGRKAVALQDVAARGASVVSSGSDKKQQQMVASSAARISSLSDRLQSLGEVDDGEDDDADSDDEGPPITQSLTDAFGSLINEAATAGDEEEKGVFSKGITYDAAGNEIALRAGGDKKSSLFQGLVFFINREVPLDWMQLLIISAGGTVGWEGAGSPFDTTSSLITHHVIDRPLDSSQQALMQQHQREFVQPQWLFDCLNISILLPVSKYAPGIGLPPHLSPFVDDQKEGYVPEYRQELLALSGSGTGASNIGKTDGNATEDGNAEEGDNYEDEVRAERSGARKSSVNKAAEPEASSEDGDDDDEQGDSESGDEEDQNAATRAALKAPTASAKGPKGVVYKPKQGPAVTEDLEAKELSKSMMGKKTKRLYDRMQHGLQKKQDEINKLNSKREEVAKITKKAKRDADKLPETSEISSKANKKQKR